MANAKPGRVLETAAGTGILTRALARLLPDTTEIVATDLNQPMLDFAAAQPGATRVTWRSADALSLPFFDRSFDVVVCQFGAMFFPDKVAAYREAMRVLRPGGSFVFSVWDRIEENEFAAVVTEAVAALFPGDPPSFLARTPHGYHDEARIRGELAAAGFARVCGRDDRTSQPRPSSAIRQSAIARARRCATRSKPAMPLASTRPPMRPLPRSGHVSALARSTGKCRPM